MAKSMKGVVSKFAKLAPPMPTQTGTRMSGKKCIPGVICVENMTLFMLFVIFILLVYMFMQFQRSDYGIYNRTNNQRQMSPTIISSSSSSSSSSPDTFNDPYAPPLKNDGLYFPSDNHGSASMMAQHIAILQTRSFSPEYTQIGILTRDNGTDMILPLMGRRTMNGRSKYQYYTISNTGTINTKLPIKVRGRSCTNEYGCDEIMSGDTVYVEGYKETFQTTIYENSTLAYIP
jgi:hypothetical protein